MAQRIPTGLNDTHLDHKVAEKRRALLQKQIDQEVFDWNDWIDRDLKTVKWRDAINALYKKRVINGRTSEKTWEINFMGRLRQAPMTKEVTSKSIIQFINKWSRDTCSYKETFYLLKDMCQLVNVPFPELPVPTYTTGQIKEVPSDDEIVQAISVLTGPLQWHLATMATYGLRNHETLQCQFLNDSNRLQVEEKTKTGFRIVIPLHPEWVDLFDLRNIRKRDSRGLSQWLFNERKKAGISWKPYALRHSFAGRLWSVGGSRLDIYTAARLLGHSVQIHTKTYRQFIDPVVIAEKAEQILWRLD